MKHRRQESISQENKKTREYKRQEQSVTISNRNRWGRDVLEQKIRDQNKRQEKEVRIICNSSENVKSTAMQNIEEWQNRTWHQRVQNQRSRKHNRGKQQRGKTED